MLMKFAMFLQAHRSGILAWYDHPITTGLLEGTNNKIKTTHRQAYGYRGQEFFKLKILDSYAAATALLYLSFSWNRSQTLTGSGTFRSRLYAVCHCHSTTRTVDQRIGFAQTRGQACMCRTCVPGRAARGTCPRPTHVV